EWTRGLLDEPRRMDCQAGLEEGDGTMEFRGGTAAGGLCRVALSCMVDTARAHAALAPPTPVRRDTSNRARLARLCCPQGQQPGMTVRNPLTCRGALVRARNAFEAGARGLPTDRGTCTAKEEGTALFSQATLAPSLGSCLASVRPALSQGERKQHAPA